MDTIWIASTTNKDFPLKRVPVTKTKCLDFPATTPPWEIHRTAILFLSQLAVKKSRNPVFLSGLTAALQYGAPFWKTRNIIFLTSPKGTNNQGTFGCYRGVSAETSNNKQTIIKRHHRNYPPSAYTHVNGIPTLTRYFTLIELLCLADPKEAIVPADAIARQILGATRFNKEIGKENWKHVLKDLTDIAHRFFPKNTIIASENA